MVQIENVGLRAVCKGCYKSKPWEPKPSAAELPRERIADAVVEKQGQENAKKVPPKCAALLLCDAVTRDDVSRKTNIIGVFDTFCLESVPGSTARCTIFLRLVDMTGRFAITAEVHDKERGLVLFRTPGAGECGNPDERTSAELWLPMAPLVFDRAGAYDLVMFADEEEIARIEFQITVPSEGGFWCAHNAKKSTPLRGEHDERRAVHTQHY
jgi:hypothetical protein